MNRSKNPAAGEERRLFWRQMFRPMVTFTIIVAAVFCLVVLVALAVGSVLVLMNVDFGWATSSSTLAFLLACLIALAVLVWMAGLGVLLWRGWGRLHGALPAAGDPARQQLQKVIRSRYQLRFWRSFAIYSLVLVVLAVLALVVRNSRIWYAEDPFFPILAFLRDVFPFALAAVWLGGAAVLLYGQWRQSASDIVGMIDSIEQMQLEPDNPEIAVPKNLAEVKPVLREIQLLGQAGRRQAKEAEQRKNELIIYLAHDLKTPLTSVIGYLNLLDEAPDMPPEQKARYTHIALDKANKLENLLSQFFEISRYNLHEMVLEPAYFDLHYLLLQLTDEFYPAVSAAGKSTELRLPEELWLFGDSGKLARVFNNVLRNAVAYSDKGSTITIAATQGEAETVLTFTNRGRTIPEHRLQSIFDKFYRLDEARSGDTGGAGLGLAIAREIVTLHGGEISAQSADGVTTFTVALPGARVAAHGRPAPQAEAPPAPASSDVNPVLGSP